MVSAIDRLKAFARAAAAPVSSMERRIVAATGLPVVWEAARDPVHAAVAGALAPAAAAEDFAALAVGFDRLFAEKEFCGTGYRTYRVAHEALMAPMERAAAVADGRVAEACLARYADWWARNKSDPAAAAVYARALTVAGYVWRGSGCAESVAAEGWDKLRDYCGQARGVLAHAGPRGRRHWLWRQADFTLTFAAWGCEAEDEGLLLPSFAAVQTLDPHEFGIYDDRALHLLPRWSGSLAAVDRFARASADRTAAQFGELLYARIYDTVLGYEDPETTLVDAGRLLRGFGDWFERFPGQALANRYAAHAHAFGDFATLETLFRDGLREIHPGHWFDRDQPIEAWRAVAAR